MNPYSILNEFDKWFAWQRQYVECMADLGFHTGMYCRFDVSPSFNGHYVVTYRLNR